MKLRVLTAFAALILNTSAAISADLPRKDATQVFAPAADFGWNGFYVGLSTGYVSASSDRVQSANPLSGPPAVLSSVNGFGTRSIGAGGFIGGGQIGFNRQINRIVLGIEADGSFTTAGRTLGPASVPGVPFGNFLTSETRTDWIATFRPRLGIALERLLVYGTGGLAIGSVKASDYFKFAGVPVTTPPGSNSSVRFGWTLGFGLEYALAANLTAKIEYLHADLGRKSYVQPAFAGAPPVTNMHYSDKTSLNIIRAGVNYKF